MNRQGRRRLAPPPAFPDRPPGLALRRPSTERYAAPPVYTARPALPPARQDGLCPLPQAHPPPPSQIFLLPLRGSAPVPAPRAPWQPRPPAGRQAKPARPRTNADAPASQAPEPARPAGDQHAGHSPRGESVFARMMSQPSFQSAVGPTRQLTPQHSGRDRIAPP